MSALDAEAIRAPISGNARACLEALEVFPVIESTNSYLMSLPAPSPGRYRVAVADHQTAGRGRRDRIWYAPPSSSLCLSIAYAFRRVPEKLTGLTLVLGIGAVQALERLGIREVALKWPNDIIARGAKLGGILTEVRSGGASSNAIVAGIGLNVDLPKTIPGLGRPPSAGRITDLKALSGNPPARDALAVAMIESVFGCLLRFESDGFGPFRLIWKNLDWLEGKKIIVELPSSRCSGIAEGVDDDGALLVRAGGRRRRIVTGSVRFPATSESY